MELAEVARLIEGAAALSGFDDMREAAAAMAREQAPQQLYDFGYECIECGIPFLAIPALRRALAMMPGEPALLMAPLPSHLVGSDYNSGPIHNS